MNTIKVSICVPVYGVEKYIERCALSLFGQTYENLEYIFVNDNTPDKSWEILQSVIAKYPQLIHRIILHEHETNRGLAAARNTAIKLATGSFLTWVDSDDWLEPDAIEKLVTEHLRCNADIVTCNTIKLFSGGKTDVFDSPIYSSRSQMLETLLRKQAPVSIWARLIRTSLYIDNNIEAPEGLNCGEDFCVIPRLVYFADNVSSISDRLYHYNCENESSYTYNYSTKRSDQVLKAFDILEVFLKNRNEHELLMSFFAAKTEMLVRELADCCRISDQKRYNSIYSIADSLLKDYVNTLPMHLKVVARLKYYHLNKLYVIIGTAIRKFL